MCQTHADKAGSLIGMEITGLLTLRQIRLDLIHKISDNWSVTGRAAINIDRMARQKDKEEQEHDNEFISETIWSDYNKSVHHEMIIMQYWPEGTFHKTYMSVGGRFRSDSTADLMIGIGRHIRIFRRMVLLISLETDIIDSFRKGTFAGEGISACICITF